MARARRESHYMVGGTPKKMALGLAGYPVAHSFSQAYFERKFTDLGISGSYSLMPLPHIAQLKELLQKHPELRGFNVTIPHKSTILPYLQSLTPEAVEIGAVNTVAISHSADGTLLLHGANTDSPAFRTTLIELIGTRKMPERALIFGSGGASKAVSHALSQLGISWRIVSRHPHDTHSISYEQLQRTTIESTPLLVNTTPVGMWPHIEETLPIPYDGIGPDHICYDLIYNPTETEFLRQSRERGALTTNGLSMLHRQADLAWEIWNSLE